VPDSSWPATNKPICDKLVSIAERDGSIDADEARMLNSIIDKLVPAELDQAMRARVEALREQLAPLL
jgi:polyhydroxyalkanoate synthesis regulator phasin